MVVLRSWLTLSLLMGLLFVAQSAVAGDVIRLYGEENVGTAGAQFLRIPVGARAVAMGKAAYPEDILDELTSRGIKVVAIDAFAVAKEVGELRTANVAMVGAMSNFLAINKQVFLDVIDTRVKEAFREVNKQAFEAGRTLVYS